MKSTPQGFALPTLMVMLALASIATLLAMRNLWVNEQLINAQADQLRTLHKAEAIMPVALADILGAPTNNDGTMNLRHVVGNATQNHAFFPSSISEYELLRQRLSSEAHSCSAGICTPNALDPKATTATFWKSQTSTALSVSASDMPDDDKPAQYWVEVFPAHSTSPDSTSVTPPFVYRITAMSHGLMPGSTTVLQAIWTRTTTTSLSGQWHSWHVLHDSPP